MTLDAALLSQENSHQPSNMTLDSKSILHKRGWHFRSNFVDRLNGKSTNESFGLINSIFKNFKNIALKMDSTTEHYLCKSPFLVVQHLEILLDPRKRDMIICSNCDCSKNLLDTILLLLDSIRTIIFFLVNCSNPVNLWELTWFEQINF